MSYHDFFLERLQQCPQGPWTLFDGQLQLDQLVLQPLPIPHGEDAVSFLDFLCQNANRRLLSCFLGPQCQRWWSFEDLLHHTRPLSAQSLQKALQQCQGWFIALQSENEQQWRGHPRVAVINNLGWTFEWLVQVLLERHFDALVRRHVILGEMVDFGEFDILAFLGNGQSVVLECKSSTKRITNIQLERFVAKSQRFPADRALFLIDSDDTHQMQQRMGQLALIMGHAFGEASIGELSTASGSTVIRLRDHLFVADTAGGILTTLKAILSA